MKNKWGLDSGWLKSMIIAFFIALFFRTVLFAPVIVDGASMEPTLHDRERIIVNKTISWIGKVHRGDIVIIKDDKEGINYVKRVIGLPGDVIEMKSDQLWINKKRVSEPYLEENRKMAKQMGSHLTEDFGPLTVPKNHFFVMGDNRLRSIDSRHDTPFTLGYIASDRIIGKSKLVIAPIKNIRVTE